MNSILLASANWLEQLLVFLPALLLSAALGGVVGLERDRHGRAAGVRTNLVVSLGATIFTLLAQYSGGDPSRITAQIVSGIGFLGAGLIIKSGMSIKGLTSAATLWFMAAIGVACGYRWFSLAIIGTILVLIALEGLDFTEKMYSKDRYFKLSIRGGIDLDARELRRILDTLPLHIKGTKMSRDFRINETKVVFNIKLRTKEDTDDIGNQVVEALQSNISLAKISWTPY